MGQPRPGDEGERGRAGLSRGARLQDEFLAAATSNVSQYHQAEPFTESNIPRQLFSCDAACPMRQRRGHSRVLLRISHEHLLSWFRIIP